MYLGLNIKHLRKAKGISQVELAKLIGTTHSSISTYEQGKTEPTAGILKKISEVLQVSMDNLVGVDLTKPDDIASKEGKSMLSYVEDLETGKRSVEEVSKEVGDENMNKIIKLLELRVNELELAIKRSDPELAKELKIE